MAPAQNFVSVNLTIFSLKHLEMLQIFAPLAKRIHGVKGIFEAHKKAAEHDPFLDELEGCQTDSELPETTRMSAHRSWPCVV